jgi:NAD(P)-dependent dehydrogenase (short-subunit alcohol dehydrogenase family)
VRATPTRYLYPAIKAALLQHTRSLAVHLAPQGIRVNAIMPGTFRTDRVEKAYTEEQLENTAKGTPLGRVAAPTELVGPARFLVSDMSSYVTGAVLTVDGGQTLIA